MKEELSSYIPPHPHKTPGLNFQVFERVPCEGSTIERKQPERPRQPKDEQAHCEQELLYHLQEAISTAQIDFQRPESTFINPITFFIFFLPLPLFPPPCTLTHSPVSH